MVFVKKSTFFLYVFLSETSLKETFFYILDRKECFFDLKSEVLKKSRKSTFCKGVSPWFLSKNRPFCYMFFVSEKSQKQTVFDILENKEWFLDLKSEVLKKSKKAPFCKEVSPWFMSKKSTFFLYVFFSKKRQKQTVFDILDRKESFLDLKSQVLKKSRKSTFCKRASAWIMSKNRPFFHMFFLSQESQKETCFDILDRKKCFLDHKSKVLKKTLKNRHFPVKLVRGFCQKIDLFLICSFLSKTKPETKSF